MLFVRQYIVSTWCSWCSAVCCRRHPEEPEWDSECISALDIAAGPPARTRETRNAPRDEWECPVSAPPKPCYRTEQAPLRPAFSGAAESARRRLPVVSLLPRSEAPLASRPRSPARPDARHSPEMQLMPTAPSLVQAQPPTPGEIGGTRLARTSTGQDCEFRRASKRRGKCTKIASGRTQRGS